MTFQEFRSERGSILILTAVSLTVLMGVTALAVEGGLLFDTRQRMQSAADAGALASALEVKRDSAIPIGNLRPFADNATKFHGFENGVNGVTVTVNHPPTSGRFNGQVNYVEVIISNPVAMSLMRLFNRSSMTVQTRAVAGAAAGGGNFVIFGENNSGVPNLSKALELSGGSSLTLDGSLVVNSTDAAGLKVGGTLKTGQGANTVGGYDPSPCSTCYKWSSGAWVVTQPTTGVSPVTDPLASQPIPSCSGTCATGSISINSGSLEIYQGNYTDITISGTATAHFNPGVYVITGNLDMKNSVTVTGTGVTFYLTSGKLNMANSGTNITLSAPTTGTNAGMLFFSARTNATDWVVSGGANVYLNGIIYQRKAGSKFTFSGGSDAGNGTQYTIFIVNQFVLGGGGVFTGINFPSALPIVGTPTLGE